MPSQTFNRLKSNKKERIIEAALHEFARHDFEHVNIQNIIKDAQISRGSFYQYFEDLDDLFGLLVDVIVKEKKSYLFSHMSLPETAPFFDRIKELYRWGYQFALDHPNIFNASKSMMDHMQNTKNETVLSNQQGLIDYYKASITYDISQGAIRKDVDIDMLINVFMLFLDDLLKDHFIEQRLTQAEVDQRFERFITLLKKGIE